MFMFVSNLNRKSAKLHCLLSFHCPMNDLLGDLGSYVVEGNKCMRLLACLAQRGHENNEHQPAGLSFDGVPRQHSLMKLW